MDTCSSVRSTCALINRVSVVSLWVYTVVCIFDYHVLILYEYVYRKNNFYVIFAMIIIMNDDVHNIYVFIGLYQKGMGNDT